MLNKSFLLLPLLLALIAHPAISADNEVTLEAFKQEYARYQKLSKAGDWRNSLLHAKRSYEMGKRLFGENTKNTSALTYNYGLNWLEINNSEAALPILQEALDQYEKVYGKESNELIPVLMDLGNAVVGSQTGDIDTHYYDRALALVQQHYGEDSVDYAQRSVDAGSTLLLKVASEQTRDYLYNGYAILAKNLGKTAPRTGYAAFNIGKYELALNNYDSAAQYLSEALQAFSAAEQSPTTLELATHGFLALAYEKLDQREKATEHCLAIGKLTPAPDIEHYRPLLAAAPIYPPEADQQKLEGYVTLEYEVDEQGFVRNPGVVEIQGPQSFADASKEALKKFRYVPRFIDGKAVKTAGVKHRFAFENAEQ